MPTVVISEGTRNLTVMMPLTSANQHAEQDAGDRADGQRNTPANGHKDHHVRSEREGAAHGKVDLARDHQHDFGHAIKPNRPVSRRTTLRSCEDRKSRCCQSGSR